MPFGMMTTLLLFIMSSGYYYWPGGIFPGLVTSLLLFKAKLLLGPPIALGAFVLGQGSGLLIGKLIGISYIINKYIKLKRVSNHHKVSHFHLGWRRPFYYHKHVLPSPHYDWNQFPNIHFNQYNERPYGTYAYDPSAAYSYNTPYQYYQDTPGSGYYPTGSDPYTSYHQYNNVGGTPSPYYTGTENIYPSTDYASSASKYSTPLRDSNENENGGYETTHTETEPQYENHGTFQDTDSKYETESSEENYRPLSPPARTRGKGKSKENSSDDSITSAAEQYIIDQFLKSTDEQPGMSEEKKLDILADLLRDQFHTEFLGDVAGGNLKSVSATSLPVSQVKNIKLGSDSRKRKDVRKEKEFKMMEGQKEKKPPVTLISPLVDVLTKMEKGDLIPESWMSWLLDGRGGDTIEEPEFKLHVHSRKRRGAPTMPVEQNDDLSNLETEKVTSSFIQDVKNLFSIVSFLDINRCLEKMICEIHSRDVGSGVTEYEKNIVTAFR